MNPLVSFRQIDPKVKAEETRRNKTEERLTFTHAATMGPLSINILPISER